MYAAEDEKNHFPCSPAGQNASLASDTRWPGARAGNPWPPMWEVRTVPYIRWYSGQVYDPEKVNGYTGAYLAQGMLYPMAIIDSPELFFCPGILNSKEFSWPQGWDGQGGWRSSGYLYRLFGQAQTPEPTYAQIDELFNMEMDAEQAMFCDLILDPSGSRGDPAHVVLEPYGLNVGFGDGHAAWKILGDKELSRLTKYSHGYAWATKDRFCYHYFRALSDGKFDTVANLFP